MTCAVGMLHSITLSDDGIVYSFGRNVEGQLGLGNKNEIVSVPSPIPNLFHIKQVACGCYFTICVDEEGILCSFGRNFSGQLGTGNRTSFNVPQKILDIPPVLTVSCGSEHTLIITNNNLNLWSCGNNEFGQLCLGNIENEILSKFQQTSYFNIEKVHLVLIIHYFKIIKVKYMHVVKIAKD